MTKLLRLLLMALPLVVVSLLVGGPASATTYTLRMDWTPETFAASFDPAAVAVRCPDGWAERGAAILTATGSGQLTYGGQTVDVTTTQSHCTVPRPAQSPEDLFARAVTPLDIEAGHLIVSTPDGTLFLDYRAPGVLKGDLTLAGFNSHTFNGPYTVTGGTGVFAGASGDGHLFGLAEVIVGPNGAQISGYGILNGSLRLAG